jgi:hypothetical protein
MSPVSRCLAATGIRFSVILYPPGDWAFLAVGLPAERPDPDGVTAFRTHELRPGWVPPIPRGRRCSSRTEGRAQPAPAASRRPVLSPRSNIPPRGAPLHEASTRVHAIHPSGLPLACGLPDGTGTPLGFPPSSAPHRHRRRASRAGQAIEHGPQTMLTTSAEPPILRVHSLRATSRRTVRSGRLMLDLRDARKRPKSSSALVGRPHRDSSADVLADAARHQAGAGPIGACGHTATHARIDLGWNPRHC